MRLKTVLVALSLSLASLLSSTAAKASDVTTLTLTGVGGQSTDGIYVYPYEFTVATTGGATDYKVDLSCLSFNREISVGESWQVDVYSVNSNFLPQAGASGLTETQFLEDAYLYNQYHAAELEGGSAGAQQISDIQFAIWYIMDPTSAVTSESGYDGNAAALVAAATKSSNYGSSSALAADANDVVYIPVPGTQTGNDGLPQIFMGNAGYAPLDGPLPATPEPTSLLLLGTGMMGMVFIMRRKLMNAELHPTK
jgi:hypothetical protein